MFFVLNIVFDIFIFQNCLLTYIPQLTYIDEIFTFILIIASLFSVLSRKNNIQIYSSEVKIIILFCIFLFVGVISSLLYNIQPEKIAIYKDILAISKFVICYICTLIVSNNVDKDLILKKVAKKSRIYITIIFVFSIINLFYEIGMSGDTRYGIRSYKFMYQHPTYLVSAIIILLCVVMSDIGKKFDKFILFEAIVILILTLRNKVFVFVVGYIFIKIVMKYAKDIKMRYILILAVLGILMTYTKISEYISYSITAARPALYIVGYNLAYKYFPLGSGFGTFASTISGEYYSPIYYEYGINTVTGLQETMHSYIGDTFWPYIYGQFGFIGLVIFLLIIVNIFKSLKNRYRISKKQQLAAFLLLIYILIASIAEAIFTDVTGCFSFVILATYLGCNSIDYNLEKNT